MKDKRLAALIGIFYMVYVISALFFKGGADWISPVHNVMIGLVILTAVKSIRQFKSCWILIAFIPFVWGLADFIWLYQSVFTSSDPAESTFLLYVYGIPNLLMLMATILYFVMNIKRWHRIQLSLDMGLIFMVVLGLSSGLVFSKMNLTQIDPLDFFSLILYTVTDLLTLIIMLTMITSTDVKTLPKTLYFIMVSLFIYVAADQLYVLEYYFNRYVPNQLSDMLFLLSFVIFAWGALYEKTHLSPIRRYVSNEAENMGNSKIILWLSVIPVLTWFAGLISTTHVIIILSTVFVYVLLSYYVQKLYFIEVLLQREKDLIESLETTVEERTKELMKVNDELVIRSNHDALTGLYNRVKFLNIVSESVNQNQPFSILFMDLDRFKVINDLHGHSMGDIVLQAISNRLRSIKNEAFLISRFGGDEFAILLPFVDHHHIEMICRELLALIEMKIEVEPFQFFVGVSMGISQYPMDAQTSEQLMKFADIAMYHAKMSDSTDRFAFYTSHLIARIERRNHIELLLRDIKYDEAFELYYQPQFDTQTRQLIGMEALLRWHHDVEGFISPAEFIPIAEETGMIVTISEWVIKKAMQQIVYFNTAYKKDLVMGINMSPLVLDSIGFYPMIDDLIRSLAVKAHWLDFEITEHSAMNSSANMQDLFLGLNHLGIKVSIDDFGTGYSSLSYIKRFDVDTLKIAKELVDNISTGKDDYLIVKAIIMMAEGMGLKTIAEGVETLEQLQLLEKLKCNAIQGYVLGRPVNAEKFEEKYLRFSDVLK